MKILDVDFDKKELIYGLVCGASIIFLSYIFISLAIAIVRVII